MRLRFPDSLGWVEVPAPFLRVFISLPVFESAVRIELLGTYNILCSNNRPVVHPPPMAPREELVTSAVTFLRDPSVASSPLDKRLEFLKSKNLTQEEIDLALSQAGGGPTQSPPANQPYYPPPQQYQQPPPGYYPPPYGSQWPPAPPPEPPKRDWRDLFILATTITGASYALYVLANRYIKPLIAPPTPPQLQQDKESIDEQFTRAFALLDTLTEDTATLKSAEETRTKRLDTAIADIETVLADLKAAKQRQEDDARRMEAEMKNIRDSLPRSIENVKDGSERQLKDLSGELASLKSLMLNRLPSSSTPSYSASSMPNRAPPNTYFPTNRTSSGTGVPTQSQTQTQTQPADSTPTTIPGISSNPTGVNNASTIPSFATPSGSGSSTSTTNVTAPKPGTMNLGYGAGKVSIPAWQLAAQNKKDKDEGTSASGTVSDGADAVAALQAS